MTKIKDIKARQIFDSRGNPTVEVDVITNDNIIAVSYTHLTLPTTPYV